MSTNPFQIQLKIRNAFLLALRDIFSPSNNPAGWKYPYIENAQGMWDYDHSKIFISDIIPQDNAAFPALVIDTYSGNETRYLGEDQNQVKNSFHVVTEDNHFASITSTVTINIYIIDDTIARDEIIDTIYDHFKDITHQLAINGIEIIKSTMPSETRVMQDNRWWITNRIVIDVYSEWRDTPLPIVNISGLGITVPIEQNLPPVITSPILYSWANQTVPFTIASVDTGTNLTVNNTNGLVSGDTIKQGSPSTIISSITDGTHLVVISTTGFIAGAASMIIPFNYNITAINSPTSFGATGLPSQLSVNAGNGLISGNSPTVGTFYVTLSAINAAGIGTESLTLTIT